MNKKTIIVFTLIATLLFAAIGVAVYFLYKDVPVKTSRENQNIERVSGNPLLAAVPSDAAAVIVYSSLDKALEQIFKSISTQEVLEPFSSAKTVVSLHYNGDFAPMAIFDAGRASADTSAEVKALIDQLPQKQFYVSTTTHSGRNLVQISASETLLSSSSRHLAEGASILGNPSFASLCSEASSKDIIFVSSKYAGDFLAEFIDKDMESYTSFLKKVADWMAISIDKDNKNQRIFSIQSYTSGNPTYYMSMLDELNPGDSRVAQIVPSNSDRMISIVTDDIDQYLDLYTDYLDARSQLQAFEKQCSALRSSSKINPKQWVKDMDLKEIANANWKDAEGNRFEANFMRFDKDSPVSEIQGECTFGSYASTLFGSAFKLEDESAYLTIGNWIISGSKEAVASVESMISEGSTLSEYLEEAEMSYLIPSKNVKTVVYFAQPKVLSYTTDGLIFEEQKFAPVVKGVAASDATSPDKNIEVPKGPFKVTNVASGKKNTFYQNEHLSLCLNDENGRGLWGVPFKEPICGYVSDIDYYNNGKIQFIFAAGTKVYIIDRLGRFVNGFPIDLGKKVVLGPSLYDFSGAKAYNIMVLHDDNTIEMYNLKANKPAEWKGISDDAGILGLPELKTIDGHKYWKVNTTAGIAVFDFMGGDKITDKKILNEFK